MPDEQSRPLISSAIEDRQLATLEMIEEHLAFFREQFSRVDFGKVKSHPLARFLLK